MSAAAFEPATGSHGHNPRQSFAPLEQVFNLRDIGGRRTTDGRWVRSGVLYRSDSLHRLTEADSAAVSALGLRAVLDLRTSVEIEKNGRYDGDPSGTGDVAYHHLPVMSSLLDAERVPEDVDADWVADWYVDMVTDGGPLVAQALEVLSESDRHPAVFHCTAGKDRTGVLAAVIQDLLGMSEHDIVADYALSREAVERWNTWAATADAEAAGRARTGRFAPIEPSPGVMRGFLDRMRERYGSVEAFVSGLDVRDGTVERLRILLVTDVPGAGAVA